MLHRGSDRLRRRLRRACAARSSDRRVLLLETPAARSPALAGAERTGGENGRHEYVYDATRGPPLRPARAGRRADPDPRRRDAPRADRRPGRRPLRALAARAPDGAHRARLQVPESARARPAEISTDELSLREMRPRSPQVSLVPDLTADPRSLRRRTTSAGRSTSRSCRVSESIPTSRARRGHRAKARTSSSAESRTLSSRRLAVGSLTAIARPPPSDARAGFDRRSSGCGVGPAPMASQQQRPRRWPCSQSAARGSGPSSVAPTKPRRKARSVREGCAQRASCLDRPRATGAGRGPEQRPPPHAHRVEHDDRDQRHEQRRDRRRRAGR